MLEVDGQPLATIAIDTIERLKLALGRDVESLHREIEAEAAALRTYDRALDMLAARGRSRRELQRTLVRKGEAPELVEQALDRLAATGLLDDEQFARQFARAKVLGSGHSRRRIQQELWRKGISRETVDAAIAEVVEAEAVDESAVAESVARKKLRSLSKLDALTRRRRLYAHLARRGYDARAIQAAMACVLAEERGEATESGPANDSR